MKRADEFVIKALAAASGLVRVSLIAGAAAPATVTSVVRAIVVVPSTTVKLAAAGPSVIIEGSSAIVAGRGVLIVSHGSSLRAMHDEASR